MIHDIFFSTLTGGNPFRIIFDKTEVVIYVHARTRYSTMFGSDKYDDIYLRIRYPIWIKKVSITYVFSHYYKKNKACSFDSLLLGKILALRNVLTQLSQLKKKIKITSTVVFSWKNVCFT